MSNTYAVIMAGGVGSRFWPRSRESSPKQLLQIFGQRTMIQATVDRITPLIPPERMYIVTNSKQRTAITAQVPAIPAENILVEPVGRSTAPCIGLAAFHIEQCDPDGIMVVLPADHLIHDEAAFLAVLQSGIETARQSGGLGTIGITPTYPETGFGYIQVRDKDKAFRKYAAEGVFEVKTFAEKPNLETAQKFLASGEFFWNSGMFIWGVKAILQEIQIHLPEIYEHLVRIAATIGRPDYWNTLEDGYGRIRSISIDYGVMEKAGNVFMVNGNFSWSDVGSWDEVSRLTGSDERRNSFKGIVVSKDSSGNYVEAGEKVVALVGVEDLIVISTADSVLVCKKGMSQDVKEVVDHLRRKQMNEYL